MTHRVFWTVLAVLTAASPAGLQARTETFLETNPDQFEKGKADGVVSTSLGTLRLGRALDDLLAETEGVEYVARCAAGPGGAVFAVTGGSGRVYRARDGKVTLYATLPDPYLFSVAVDNDGRVYAGSGGTKGRLWRISPPAGDRKEPQAEVLFEDDAVQYIWDLALMADGSIAAATGDQGLLLRVQPDGKHETLLDAEGDHVLCLATGPGGTLYAGTDGEAVVYRWADGEPFILYDADENEVTALATDVDGNLYVGTSSGAAGRTGGVTVRAAPTRQKPAAKNGSNGEAAAENADAADPAPAGTALAEAKKIAHTINAARQAGAKNGGKNGGGAAGAAVYRISADGIATPLFEASEAMVLALAVADGRLLVGTGDPARIHEVDLARDGEEQACLATLDPKQVMALCVPDGDRPIVASAGPGRMYVLSEGHAREGMYTSQVYDASGSARWGALSWRGRTPDGTELRLATRTGNVKDPEKGMWSAWSKGLEASPGRIASPPARYIQFRVTMRTGDPDRTPVLEQFEAAYLRANESPRILSISEIMVGDRENRAQAIQRFRQAMKKRRQNAKQKGGPPRPPPPEGAQPIRIIQWEAEDPNGDTLHYSLHFRGRGEERWVLLEDGLARPEYAWDTATVADGWYELKVVATDRPDHPAETALADERISDLILIDNSRPAIENVQANVHKDGQTARAIVTFTAQDAISRLTEGAFTVDSATDWRPIAPTDDLFDARREEFRFTAPDLAPGPHRIGIRVVDEANNHGHAAVTVVVE